MNCRVKFDVRALAGSTSRLTSATRVGSAWVQRHLQVTQDYGQRTKIVREDGTRIYFSYDLAHRLTGENWLDPSDVHLYAFAYDYDAAGNRLKKTFNGETTYYNYNNLNQLTTEAILGGEATYYTWTADGAMATKHDVTGWTYYTWDVDESLRTIQAPNVTLDNRYNARMQRVRREEDSEPSNLIYDAQKLIAEATEEGLTRYYLSEGGSVYSPLVSQLGSQHWQLFDALGTVLGLTATDGSQSDSFLYEAFGTSLGITGGTATPLTFLGSAGLYADPSVGGYDYWGLLYFPATGMTGSASGSAHRPFVYPTIGPAPYRGPVVRAPNGDEVPVPDPNPDTLGYEACLAWCLITGIVVPPQPGGDDSGRWQSLLSWYLEFNKKTIAREMGLFYLRDIRCDGRYHRGLYSKTLKLLAPRIARVLGAIGLVLTIYSAYTCTRDCSPHVLGPRPYTPPVIRVAPSPGP